LGGKVGGGIARDLAVALNRLPCCFVFFIFRHRHRYYVLFGHSLQARDSKVLFNWHRLHEILFPWYMGKALNCSISVKFSHQANYGS
jgi:hypothetical protein